MKALVLLKITSGEVKEACSALQKLKSVVESWALFGRYDAVAIIQAENLEEIGQIVASEIQPISGVVETVPCLIVEHASQLKTEQQKEALDGT